LGLAALSFRQEALLWSEALKGPYTETLQVLGAPRSLLRARGTLRRPQGGKHLLFMCSCPTIKATPLRFFSLFKKKITCCFVILKHFVGHEFNAFNPIKGMALIKAT